MPQITTRPHNVTGYAAAVVADKRRHLTTYVILKAMEERNFCSQGVIVTRYECDKRRQRLIKS